MEVYTNHLSGETSPYLLLHVHNPVDWYPWTDEAFKKAADEDKPVFLSIGYSTCHWCHVMERESFTNKGIADILNKNFVSIKVDREEHPDIDSYYQTAVQAITGPGGWPLSVFITPDKKVFYGGTYFPPEDKWGRPGLKTVILTLADKWKNDRNEIMQSADSVSKALIRYVDSGASHKGEQSVDRDILKTTVNALKTTFDVSSGGFGTVPKFPSPQNLLFLLRYWKRTGNADTLSMVIATLNSMQNGGIQDQIGGGFHRYSTDRNWLVPHYEKMLYDQALLLRAYTEAYLATGTAGYSDTARSVIRYVSHTLTSPEGGFYTAQDADSLPPDTTDRSTGKEEGAFYLFTIGEIQSLLSAEEAKVFMYRYGIKESGNIPVQGAEDFSEKNILYRAHTLKETSEYTGIDKARVKKLLSPAADRLYTYRGQRPKPAVDTKILTSWNGLMISSLAYASRSLHDKRYLAMAEKAADFIMSELRDENGRLLHSYTGNTGGKAAIPGMLDDYAFFILGLLDLYMADFKVEYLEAAKELMDIVLLYFRDSRNGGFFLTASDSSHLPVRQKSAYDGALPSGNSIAALDLIIMARLFADSKYVDRLEELFSAFASEMNSRSATGMLLAYDFASGSAKEIVLTGDRYSDTSELMINAIYGTYIPNRVIAFRYTEGIDAEKTVQLIPYTKDQLPVKGKTTAYVCENYSCGLPVTNIADLINILKE